MTKKTSSRRQRDAQALAASGRKAPTQRVQRETSSRVWYELKNIHKSSAAYIGRTAEQIAKYAHPLVLAKIAKNGKAEKFIELNQVLQAKLALTFADFGKLWDAHKDRLYICKTSNDLDNAFSIIQGYQKFDIDFYQNYSGLISEMNEIFNEALGQLLEAAASLDAANATDPNVITDVVPKNDIGLKEVHADHATGHLPSEAENLVRPDGKKDETVGRGLTSSVVHLDNVEGPTDTQGYPEGQNPRTASEIGLINQPEGSIAFTPEQGERAVDNLKELVGGAPNGIAGIDLIGAHDGHPADSTVPAGKIEPDAAFEIDPNLKVGLIRPEL